MTDRNDAPKQIYVSLLLHGLVWWSGGDIRSQIEGKGRTGIEYYKPVLEEIRKHPGVGVNVHFDVYSFKLIKKNFPNVYRLIHECLDNKSIELVKSGLVDYSALVTPLDDVERQIAEWDKYVSREFGIDTDGLFIYDQEQQYHPYLPGIWKRHGVLGVCYFAAKDYDFTRDYRHEPVTLLGADNSAAIFVPSMRRGIDFRLETIVSQAYAYSRRHGFRYPIFAESQDFEMFSPDYVRRILAFAKSEPLVSMISLREYVKTVAARREIFLDQGNYDISYKWYRSSEGWFTQKPSDLHLNGLCAEAYYKIDAAEFMASTAEDRRLVSKARDNLLHAEKSTARAHWLAQAPRKWAERKALRAIRIADNLLRELNNNSVGVLSQGTSNRLDIQAKSVILAVNSTNLRRDDVVDCTFSTSRGQFPGAKNINVFDRSGHQVRFQLENTENRNRAVEKYRVFFRPDLSPNACEIFRIAYGKKRKEKAAGSKLIVNERKNELVMENPRIRVNLDLNKGGAISRFVNKELNVDFLLEGNVFRGSIHGAQIRSEHSAEPANVSEDMRERFDQMEPRFSSKRISSVGKRATYKILRKGPLEIAVRVTTIIDEEIRYMTDYCLEEDSEWLRVCPAVDFGKKYYFWFHPEYNCNARVCFKLTDMFPDVTWRMPGGAIGPKKIGEKGSGFDTFGWVNLHNRHYGLGLIVKLFPNGPRMVCLNKNKVGLSISGDKAMGPRDRLPAASYGKFSFEMIVLPHRAEDAGEIEAVYQKLNNPVLLSCSTC